MKQKMDPVKKYKLIYSGELIVIALVAIVLGVLIWVRVLGKSDHFPYVYTILTLVGSAWIAIDFIWASVSKKRRLRISYLDKILNLPLGLGLIAFDIYSLVTGLSQDVYQAKYASIFFLYIAINYIFQGIYHYFKPVPGFLDALNEEEKEPNEAPKSDIENKE